MRGAFARRPFHPGQRERLPGGAAPAGAPPPPDVIAPLLVSATINAAGTQLALLYDEALAVGSVPLASAYALGGTPSAVTGPGVAGASVLLGLSPPVLAGAAVTVSYTAGATPVRDVALNVAANLVARAVTNSSTVPPPDVAAPVLVSAVINAAGTQLLLTYNENLDSASVPAAGAFSLTGTPQTVAGVAVSGTTVPLTLSGAVLAGAVVALGYTAGGAPIQDLAGNDAANLVAQAVTNNATAAAAGPLDPLTIVASRAAAWFLSGDVGATPGQWLDSTPNGVNFTQATPASQPTIIASDPAFGGRGSVNGNGTQGLITTLWDPPAPLTQPMWFFAVLRQVTWVNGRYIWNGSGSTSIYLAQVGASPALAMNNAAAVNNNPGAALGASVRVEVLFSASVADYLKLGATLQADGVSAGIGNSTALFGLFCRSNFTVPANVKIACIGVWLGEPTPAEKAALSAWVTAYYGAGVAV
jgi:uncharacterized repeat protein (TIGR02059 family)